MKLTKKDKEFLIQAGYEEKDFRQIERASAKTFLYDDDSRRISREKALEIISREDLISGYARSAFHWTALRAGENGSVLFDASRYFKSVTR